MFQCFIRGGIKNIRSRGKGSLTYFCQSESSKIKLCSFDSTNPLIYIWWHLPLKLMWYSLFYSCNHSRNFLIFSFNIFLVFWAFWSNYCSPSNIERQKLGRLEKLLGNFQKKVFLQKVKNSAISFLRWILQSTTRNTTVYKI